MIKEPLWWIATAKGLADALQHRNPISWKIYRSWISLLSKSI